MFISLLIGIQYLDKRFGKYARLSAALAFSLQMTLYMGVVLYSPSLSISAVTGVSKTVAIISVGSACAIYSTIGGIKAVLATDLLQVSGHRYAHRSAVAEKYPKLMIFFLQGTLMFIAVFVVIIKGLSNIGSVGHVLSIVEQSGHIEFFKLVNFTGFQIRISYLLIFAIPALTWIQQHDIPYGVP